MSREVKAKVDLISMPDNMIKIMYVAAKGCYSEHTPIKIWEDEAQYDMLKLVQKVLRAGHLSIAEHIVITFSIAGMSRVAAQQFTRHRHATYSMKSQRYVTYHQPFKYIVPDTVKNSMFYEDYKSHMELVQIMYEEMLKDGIPAEDARYIFPNACETSLTATMNVRQLMHLANLRLCKKAQWSIREVVQQMVDLIVIIEPWLKEFLVPKCEEIGFCNEIKSCGRKPKKEGK